ncbi:MAG: hypothetical protein GEV03_19825 [Streptosporangiales bacterium]|nr:hypothetical protein [Streptosporangiales bacterium]
MVETPLAREKTIALFLDGIAVICHLTGEFSGSDWAEPTPCNGWQALDVAGHLRCLAENCHEYLDEAPNSRLARLMSRDPPLEELNQQLARQNAAALAALPSASGPEHVAAFAESARAYAARLRQHWHTLLYTYRGVGCTAGDHGGAMAVEWHLHAWDLAHALRADYSPRDADMLVAAWRAGMPWAPIGGGDPWQAVLEAAGRPVE